MRLGVIVALVVFAVAAGLLTTIDSGRDAAAESSAASPRTSILSAFRQTEPADPLTPLFASYRDLELYLPIAEEDLTEVAFHQAARDNALPMESFAPDADMTAAANKRGTGRTPPERDSDDTQPAILEGEVLRMWRSNRSGAPDTAADVGAAPGSPVYAPVTGLIIEVKPYLLYDKYEDLEIHIQPTGWPDIDLVLIHVTDPTVRAGDMVVGGVTRIASVRLMSDKIDLQLGKYTTDPGDHVHMQLNRIEQPGTTVPADGS